MSENSTNSSLEWALDDLAYHQTRVLLLVAAVSEERGHQRKLDGLTKLAKLDFLVRYPALAPRVLDKVSEDEELLHLDPIQKVRPTAVESPMTRYKFGPWDDRYYPVIGALVSRGLVKYAPGRRGSVALVATPRGRDLVRQIADDPLWREISDRCLAVARGSGGLNGSQLKSLVYERLEELMDRPHREVIS